MSEFTVIYNVLMLLMMFTVTAIEVYSLRRFRKQDLANQQLPPQIPHPNFPISHVPPTPYNVPL